MIVALCYLFLVLVSALFYHRAEAAPSLDMNRVITAYNTAYDNCKQVTDFSSRESRSAADYWCEQAFISLDSLQLNYCSGWRHPGCRPLKRNEPYQCTCIISDCDEMSIRNNVVTPFRDCALALRTHELNSDQLLVPTANFQQMRSVYDDTFEMADLWRTYIYAGHQASGSGSVQFSGGAGSSGGVHALGVAGASSGVTAGPKGTISTPYGCNQCGGKFRSQRGLFDHKRVHHSVGSDLHCYLCNLTYNRRKSYQNHMRIKHPEVTAAEKERQHVPLSEVEAYLPYACPVCQKRYSGTHGLRDHMKSHTTDDTTCHLCNRVYSTKAIFKHHLSKDHPDISMPELFERPREPDLRPFECDKCNRSYATRIGLQAHAKSHNTLETYCILCDRTFATKPSYKGHMRRRHPEVAQAERDVSIEQGGEKRPVKCDICKRGYKNAESLRQHMKYHKGKTICDVCGALFQRTSSVCTHKRKAHPK